MHGVIRHVVPCALFVALMAAGPACLAQDGGGKKQREIRDRSIYAALQLSSLFGFQDELAVGGKTVVGDTYLSPALGLCLGLRMRIGLEACLSAGTSLNNGDADSEEQALAFAFRWNILTTPWLAIGGLLGMDSIRREATVGDVKVETGDLRWYVGPEAVFVFKEALGIADAHIGILPASFCGARASAYTVNGVGGSTSGPFHYDLCSRLTASVAVRFW